tara:strand:+ start:2141 stop:2821 length:681 start_codon:yes stop_codon:yes gene_type:complete
MKILLSLLYLFFTLINQVENNIEVDDIKSLYEKNIELKLGSTLKIVEKDVFSYSSIGKDKFRLNMENGHIQKIKISENTNNKINLSWETIEKVNISFNQSYQLSTLLKPRHDNEGNIDTINLFVVINKSNGEIFYKDQGAKEWKFIPTKNLKECNSCYSFNFRYNINFFEVLEATNDNTNEIFNLIGHGVDIVNSIYEMFGRYGGDINKREAWLWQEGRCKEDDWN